MIEHTYINPEHNDHSNTNKDVYGLGFKSGDNTVNLTTPEINLGLNDFTVEIWARMEGAGDFPIPLLGFSGSSQAYRNMKILRDTRYANAIGMIMMQSPIGGFQGNSVFINKLDSTKNLHHIVITRQGTLVTATINGRLIKSVTQDRVLDFSKFVFDIANTTYFSLGRVFNYAMSADEVQMLWNGGRMDEYYVPRIQKDGVGYVNNIYTSENYYNNATISKDSTSTTVTVNSGDGSGNKYPRLKLDRTSYGKYLGMSRIDIDCECTNGEFYIGDFEWPNHSLTDSKGVMVSSRAKISIYGRHWDYDDRSGIVYINLGATSNIGKTLKIYSCSITNVGCLLELLPQNIHSTGIYNTGSLGSSHDAVLSKPNETIFHREKPYKDKQMSTGAPNFHPIAMGQECYNTVNGDIYRASIPPVEREWSVNDWKQINII